MTKIYKTAEDCFKNLEEHSNEWLYSRYVKKSNKPYNPTPKEFEIQFLENMLKEEKNGAFVYERLSSITRYPCYPTVITALWDNIVIPLKTIKGVELNLDNVCEDLDTLLFSEDFNTEFRKLSYKTKSEELEPLMNIVNRFTIDLIARRAINNEDQVSKKP